MPCEYKSGMIICYQPNPYLEEEPDWKDECRGNSWADGIGIKVNDKVYCPLCKAEAEEALGVSVFYFCDECRIEIWEWEDWEEVK